MVKHRMVTGTKVVLSHVSVQEEAIKMVFECFEKRLRNLVLNRCRQLIVKVEFFNDQVKIINESILDELFDRVIQFIRDLFLFVTIFKHEKPEI